MKFFFFVDNDWFVVGVVDIGIGDNVEIYFLCIFFFLVDVLVEEWDVVVNFGWSLSGSGVIVRM